MKHLSILLVTVCLTSGTTVAQSFKTAVAPLIESSCIHCHDSNTETGLNLEAIGHDLSDAETFRKWERVFDRVDEGEMPPEVRRPPRSKTTEETHWLR